MVNSVKDNLKQIAKAYNELYDAKSSYTLLKSLDCSKIDLMLENLEVMVQGYGYQLKLDNQGKNFKVIKNV